MTLKVAFQFSQSVSKYHWSVAGPSLSSQTPNLVELVNT